MPLDESIVSSVANSNFKVISELSVQNAISNQQAMNLLQQKAIAKSLEAMDETSVLEGLGSAAAQRGDLAKVIVDLAAAFAAAKNTTA